jgi:prepilin-type N-terminal cleavage/methylation domain-containing protein
MVEKQPQPVAPPLLTPSITVIKPPRDAGFSMLEIIVVVGLVAVISAIAVPMFNNAIAGFRLSGDARSVANAASVAKMRAASDFSRVRLYIDLNAKTHKIQVFDKTSTVCCWVTQGGETSLSTGVSFSYGVVTTSPPNTQGPIGQAPFCVDDMGADIMNTACIMFNSRGVPVDNNFSPTGVDAVYVTDGQAVYCVTVAATGLLRMWRTLPVAIPQWVRS